MGGQPFSSLVHIKLKKMASIILFCTGVLTLLCIAEILHWHIFYGLFCKGYYRNRRKAACKILLIVLELVIIPFGVPRYFPVMGMNPDHFEFMIIICSLAVLALLYCVSRLKKYKRVNY